MAENIDVKRLFKFLKRLDQCMIHTIWHWQDDKFPYPRHRDVGYIRYAKNDDATMFGKYEFATISYAITGVASISEKFIEFIKYHPEIGAIEIKSHTIKDSNDNYGKEFHIMIWDFKKLVSLKFKL